MSILPAGFKHIPNGMISYVTFDMNYDRFYVSHRVMEQYGLRFGDKVGLAYDYPKRQTPNRYKSVNLSDRSQRIHYI